jgi:NTE family protein
VEVGARTIFILQVGRVERPLSPPRRPWEVAQVAFEIARRHRFAREMAAIPAGVTAHVLPSGGGEPRDDSPWAYRDMAAVGRRISRAYTATRRYLRDHGVAVEPGALGSASAGTGSPRRRVPPDGR